MSSLLREFVSLDAPPMLAGTLAALCCGLLGNFLVLRRLSLMGDAIAHSVLPGIVVAFLIAGTRASLPMFIGAAASGLVAAALIEVVRRYGRVETGAAMGVVFTVLFALGVLLIERAAARHVDLDADCVLHGQLETLFWFPPEDPSEFWTMRTLAAVPRQVWTLALVTLITVAFISAFFKELRLAAFDPALATSLGFNAGMMHFALMTMVAAAAVASFEAVGSILVIAMFVCPAATARLLTDRLLPQIVVSAGVAVAAGVGGYLLAAFGPATVGLPNAVNAAGMMTVVSGAFLAAAAVVGPRHGVLACLRRQSRLAVSIAREDVLGLLYRAEELRGRGAAVGTADIRRAIDAGAATRRALRAARRAGEVVPAGAGVALTDAGRARARSLVRSHRLWETYLVNIMGLRPDHVHATAMDLEHVTDAEMARRLAGRGGDRVDPHDRPIPPA